MIDQKRQMHRGTDEISTEKNKGLPQASRPFDRLLAAQSPIANGDGHAFLGLLADGEAEGSAHLTHIIMP